MTIQFKDLTDQHTKLQRSYDRFVTSHIRDMQEIRRRTQKDRVYVDIHLARINGELRRLDPSIYLMNPSAPLYGMCPRRCLLNLLCYLLVSMFSDQYGNKRVPDAVESPSLPVADKSPFLSDAPGIYWLGFSLF